jgi:hypothetical protein
MVGRGAESAARCDRMRDLPAHGYAAAKRHPARAGHNLVLAGVQGARDDALAAERPGRDCLDALDGR